MSGKSSSKRSPALSSMSKGSKTRAGTKPYGKTRVSAGIATSQAGGKALKMSKITACIVAIARDIMAGLTIAGIALENSESWDRHAREALDRAAIEVRKGREDNCEFLAH